MFEDSLKLYQPMAYQTLYNALTKNKLSHCYLFVGPKGTLKKQTAFYLAQSIICQDGKPFACECCSNCLRLQEGNYADFVYLDGDKELIKADSISKLQDLFEKTALEKAGKKIFIIDNCDNMTNKAANSMLKFIEEPFNNIYGIFITTNVEKMLSTIVSRCQSIKFKPLDKSYFFQQALEKGLSNLDAHIISQLVSDKSEITSLHESKAYLQAVKLFLNFQSLIDDRNQATMYLQTSFNKINKNDKTSLKDILYLFIDIAIVFVSDYLNSYTINDDDYIKLLNKAKTSKIDYIAYTNALLESKDALKMAGNGLLVIDQLLYKIYKEKE